MKKYIFVIIVLVCLGVFIPFPGLKAQEAEEASPFSVNGDIYSSYVWRGIRYSGPSVQPSISWNGSNFTVGGWGSTDFAGTYSEADLYLSYDFAFGLKLGVTDYYYPDLEYFDYSRDTGSHAFEINAGYSAGQLSLAGNYILNKAGGAGSKGSDLYFEVAYEFSKLSVFAGAGNGWHTLEDLKSDGVTPEDDEFGLCNIGISTLKNLKISGSLSIPLTGSVIWNPQAEQFNIVAGFSL